MGRRSLILSLCIAGVVLAPLSLIACRPTLDGGPPGKPIRAIDPHPHLRWLASTYNSEIRGRRFIAQWNDAWIQEVANSGSKMQDYLVLVIANDDARFPNSQVISIWPLTGLVVDATTRANLVVVPDRADGFRIVGRPVH